MKAKIAEMTLREQFQDFKLQSVVHNLGLLKKIIQAFLVSNLRDTIVEASIS